MAKYGSPGETWFFALNTHGSNNLTDLKYVFITPQGYHIAGNQNITMIMSTICTENRRYPFITFIDINTSSLN